MSQDDRKPKRRMWALALSLILAAGGVAWLLAPTLFGADDGFIVYPAAEVAGVRYVHDYEGAPLCQACHRGRDPALVSDPVELCRSCHVPSGHNHSVGVVQRDRGPDFDLPLGAGGTVLCHSCHDPHDTKRERYGLWMDGNKLCMKCHSGH